MASEDEVDTETLQAQIDLSMSFMHGLVSSWIKPGSKQPTRSDRNSKLEDELKESMKRPPRLGVGATVPESTAASSREAARLKGQLIGKRKNRTEGDEDALTEASTRKKGRSSDDDEDEDESRAGAIRRKTKPNPFTPQKAGGASASRNTLNTSTKSTVSNRETAVLDPRAQKTNHRPNLDQEGARKGTALNTAASRAPNSPSSPGPTASKESVTPSPQRASQRTESSVIPQMKSPTNTVESGISQRSKGSSAKEAVDSQKHIDKKDHKVITKIAPDFPHSPTTSRKSTTLPVSLDSVPLLNLDGPVGGTSSGDEDEDQSQVHSPSKKRRKRRKKKKNKQNGPIQPGATVSETMTS